MATWESCLRERGGNHSLSQGRVWELECPEARIEQGVGKKSNKRPRGYKKSQPKI